MAHRAMEQVLERAESAKTDSDFTYFFSLLLVGEMMAKIIVLGLLAAIGDDKDRNRYRLEHKLVRADGLGDWSRVFDDMLSGPASQYLLTAASTLQSELTASSREGEWQYESVKALKASLDHLKIDAEALPRKSDMKRWFRLFTTLRNKTRGHGALLPAEASTAAEHLANSIGLFYRNFSIFEKSWVYLYRNLSAKYRVSSISGDSSYFEYLKRETVHSLPNGIYIALGSPRLVPLVQSDPELRDFFLANGGFDGKRFELLSYSTDDRQEGDATDYLTPPGTLPPSETEGHGELLVRGNCLSNVPLPASDYIARPGLEAELFGLLMDDRRPIVTLIGTGGVGKTSLSIQVIQKLYTESRYEGIVWLSARDVDLLSSGPKPVQRVVFSPEDMSTYYARLVLSDTKLKEKGFNARTFFEQQLQRSESGSFLFVFDNFETTQNPVEVFTWIDSFVRLPNKILITTRLREFKGDYPLEVHGMTSEEARTLVERTAIHLGIGEYLTTEYKEDLISQSEGHPYVIKILLGEVVNAKRATKVAHLVASRNELLTALFERTYGSLSPCAQRTFMTLAAWNSAVPRLALEAVLLRSIPERREVEKGIESLLHYSLAEAYFAPADNQEFIRLPLVASVFGKKKLHVSPFNSAIHADVETLQMLGPSRSDDIQLGLAKRLESFIENISRRIERGESFESYAPILEMICRTYNPGWLVMARWHMERGTGADFEKAKIELRSFLENDPVGPNSAEAWRLLGRASYQTGDSLGEVHSLIERAQLSAVPFHDVSNTANLLNRLLRDHDFEVDKDERRQLAKRLLSVLERRRGEADADDYSRMAWLALHVGQDQKAIEYATEGLGIDASNDHCRKIAQRLGLNI